MVSGLYASVTILSKYKLTMVSLSRAYSSLASISNDVIVH
jgi:hypothetical protein